VIVVEATPGNIAAKIKRMDAVIAAATRHAVLEAALVGMRIIAKAAPVDRGRLKQSVRLRRRGESGHPEVVIDAPYAAIVEVGSRPHWVPLAALIAWVRRNAAKFNISGASRRPRAGGGSRPGRLPRKDHPEVIRIARAIQRSIALRGTRPQWFVRRSLPAINKALGELLRAAKARAIKAAAGGGGP